MVLDLFDQYQQAMLQVANRLAEVGLPGAVTSVKSRQTLIDKLARYQGSALSTVQDLAGARLIVAPLTVPIGTELDEGTLKVDVRVGAGRTAQSVTRLRVVDACTGGSFTKPPKVIDRTPDGADSHGYRAVHVVVHPNGVPVEVQIRTPLQHAWAEISERLGDRWGRAFRYGGLPDNPDESAYPNYELTRREVISLMGDLSRSLHTYELAATDVDVKLIRAWLDDSTELRASRAALRATRIEMADRFREFQAMLKELAAVLGVDQEGGR